MARIAILASFPGSILQFRGPMLDRMSELGHQICVFAPASAEVADALRARNIAYVPVELDRTGLNPWRDTRYMIQLRRAVRAFEPTHAFAYTIKPVVYARFALPRATRFFPMITGLGSTFDVTSWIRRSVRSLVHWLYRGAADRAERVLFQNHDDRDAFVRGGLLRDATKAVRTFGSGVDLSHYAFQPMPNSDHPRVLVVSRLLRDKGIVEFVEAARALQPKFPHVRFQLLGAFDSNPSGLSRATIEGWTNEGVINYAGETTDVRPYLAEASIVVLPSYREGMPRSLLEAMAVGRPIVTTDVSGCRETVINGVNGVLVAARNSHELAQAIESLLSAPDTLAAMGAASRQLAEARFDVRTVNQVIVEAMGLV